MDKPGYFTTRATLLQIRFWKNLKAQFTQRVSIAKKLQLENTGGTYAILSLYPNDTLNRRRLQVDTLTHGLLFLNLLITGLVTFLRK